MAGKRYHSKQIANEENEKLLKYGVLFFFFFNHGNV